MADSDDDIPQDPRSMLGQPYDADGNPVDPVLGDQEVPEPPEDPDEGIEMQPDGSALIMLAETQHKDMGPPDDFFENLLPKLSESQIQRRVMDLLENIERDKQARKARDEQYAEGIKRTGLGGEAPGGADFEGASRAVHPVLAEGCVDFAARAMKEIFPANGPCKTKIIGKSTPEKLDKAERKRQYMNWQFTKQITGYRDQQKKLLTQLPLGGSQYKHWWWDTETKTPGSEFVPIDDVIIPSAARDFYSAQRITLQQDITEQMYARRVDSGLYVDVDSFTSTSTPEESASAKASMKVEGVDIDPYNQDGVRRTFVVNSAFESFDEDTLTNGDPAPYIIYIDETTRKCLGVVRNWDPRDEEKKKRLHWIIDYTYIHWRGPYGIGLIHLIGSLSGAITGAVRSLLDAGLTQNVMSGLKLQGGKDTGTTESPNVGEVTTLQGPTAGSVDDIRKLFMPYPFNPPSQTLMALTEFLVNEARGVVQVASEKLADGKTDMPVGSTLAMIEEGSHVFSDIHSGLHNSQGKEMEVLHLLNSWWLSDKETVEELGDLVVSREDFEGPCDIVPVSDPSIFSEVQRFAQIQAVHNLLMNPLLGPKIDVDEVLRRTMQLLHLPDPDKLIHVAPEPEDLDPVSENMMVALGEQPVKAFEFQDHIAHLKVHLHFITSPMFGKNPMIGMKFVVPLLQHCFEHMIYEYTSHCVAAAKASEAMGMKSSTPDGRFADSINQVDTVLSSEFTPLGPMFQAAMQLAQQYQQQAKPPMDPSAQVQLQIGMAEVDRKKAADQAQQKFDSDKLQSESQREQAALAAKQQREQQEGQQKQQMDALVQAQKDQREQQELQAENMREQWKLNNDQILEHIKQQHETHRASMQTYTDGVNQRFQDSLAPLHEAVQTLAKGGEAKANQQPMMVQQDPEHTAAMQALVQAMTAQQQQPQPQDNSEQTVKVFAQLFQQMQQGQQQQTQMLVEGLTQMGQQIAQGLQAGLAQVARSNERIIGSMDDLNDQMSEVHAAQGGSVDDLRKSMEALHKSVSSPRIRELRKDKMGRKYAIDRQANEGDEIH